MPQSGGELCLISQGEAVEKASSLGWDLLVPKTVGSSWPQEVSRWVAKCSLRVSHEPQGLGEQPDYSRPLAKLAERKWNQTSETVALHKTKRGKDILQKEKGFTAGQPSKETEAKLRSVSLMGFCGGYFFCGSREQDGEAALKYVMEMKEKFQEFCAQEWLSMSLHRCHVQYQDSSTCYTW